MEDGTVLRVSDAGLDAAQTIHELPDGLWKSLMYAAVSLGRGALRAAGFDPREHVDVSGIEQRLSFLTAETVSQPNQAATDAAIELLVMFGQVQESLGLAPLVDAFVDGRRGNSDGGKEAKKAKQPVIDARDAKIRRLNDKIKNLQLSDSARAKLIAPKLAEWRAAKESRGGVGIGDRVIREQLAALRK